MIQRCPVLATRIISTITNKSSNLKNSRTFGMRDSVTHQTITAKLTRRTNIHRRSMTQMQNCSPLSSRKASTTILFTRSMRLPRQTHFPSPRPVRRNRRKRSKSPSPAKWLFLRKCYRPQTRPRKATTARTP